MSTGPVTTDYVAIRIVLCSVNPDLNRDFWPSQLGTFTPILVSLRLLVFQVKSLYPAQTDRRTDGRTEKDRERERERERQGRRSLWDRGDTSL